VCFDPYSLKSHKTLLLSSGTYKSLADHSLPDPNSPDYHRVLLYKTRALIALNQTTTALQLLSTAPETISVKAASALARYVAATEDAGKESSLEELRDLSVEIEGDDVDGDERDKALVKVLAGTAFARAGEIEEALETLGTDTEDLEA
jgi:coatomer protein complex subunit epsilon